MSLEIEFTPSVSLRPELQVVVRPVLIIRDDPKQTSPTPIEDADEYMTAEEAAAYIKVHPDTLRRWVRLGVFPRIPLPGKGKDFRFSKELIDDWARKRALGK